MEKVVESFRLSFSYANIGLSGYAVSGKGANRFGSYILEGEMERDGTFVLYRQYVALPKKPTAPSPIKISKLKGASSAGGPRVLSARQLAQIERDEEVRRHKLERLQRQQDEERQAKKKRQEVSVEQEKIYHVATMRYFREADPQLDEAGFSLNPDLTVLPLSELILRQPVEFALPADWHAQKGKAPWAPYRTLTKNKYRPPHKRFAALKPGTGKYDDEELNDRVSICNCREACGPRCQNRSLYLECGKDCRAARFTWAEMGGAPLRAQGGGDDEEEEEDDDEDAPLCTVVGAAAGGGGAGRRSRMAFMVAARPAGSTAKTLSSNAAPSPAPRCSAPAPADSASRSWRTSRRALFWSSTWVRSFPLMSASAA
jgi:hypothetical protein